MEGAGKGLFFFWCLPPPPPYYSRQTNWLLGMAASNWEAASHQVMGEEEEKKGEKLACAQNLTFWAGRMEQNNRADARKNTKNAYEVSMCSLANQSDLLFVVLCWDCMAVVVG